MLWKRLTAMLVIISMLSACVSYTPIALQTSPSGDIQLSAPIEPGDRVRLVKKSGEVSEFRVVAVEEGSISSESLTYELDEVQSMEVLSADNERVTLIVVIGLVTLGLAFFLADQLEDDLECAITGC